MNKIYISTEVDMTFFINEAIDSWFQFLISDSQCIRIIDQESNQLPKHLPCNNCGYVIRNILESIKTNTPLDLVTLCLIHKIEDYTLYTLASHIFSKEHEIYQQQIRYSYSFGYFLNIPEGNFGQLVIYCTKHENYTVLRLEQRFSKNNRLHGYDAAFSQLQIIQFSVLSSFLFGRTSQLFIKILNSFFQWIQMNPIQTGDVFRLTFYLKNELFEKLYNFYIPIDIWMFIICFDRFGDYDIFVSDGMIIKNPTKKMLAVT